MVIDQPEACANCHTRLHPLEVSELYRGKKLDCHVCGYRLKAVATGAWAAAGAVVVGLGPWLSSALFQHDGFFAELLIIVAVATIAWLAPPGLPGHGCPELFSGLFPRFRNFFWVSRIFLSGLFVSFRAFLSGLFPRAFRGLFEGFTSEVEGPRQMFGRRKK